MDTAATPAPAPGPFVKKFRTRSSCYVYDVNTNRIIRVDEVAFQLIDHFKADSLDDIPPALLARYGSEAVSACGRQLGTLARDYGVFSPSRPVVCRNRTLESLERQLSSGLHQLVLELTQSCNLSCRYCVYSGCYPDERRHSGERMSVETAFRAIDFFLARADTKAREVPVTFYGGEPLLNFPLLKACVDYAAKIGGARCHTGLTTNGVLLDETIARFLIERNVRVTISLDGPRSIHDRWRLDAARRGTYVRVRRGLDLIRRLDPEYFDRSVSLNVVLAPPLELGRVKKFFFHTPEFSELRDRIRFNFIYNPGESDLRDEAFTRAEASSRRRLARARRTYEQALAAGTLESLDIERALFLALYFTLWKRPLTLLDGTVSPAGFCVPGTRRLYVDSRGRFFMCEKMAHHLPIGDLRTGFDLEAIAGICSKVDNLHSDCGRCWAVRLCSKCFSHLRAGDELSADKLESLCRKALPSLESGLISFCRILEHNPNAFKSFDSIALS
jgi:uncharacterized protein